MTKVLVLGANGMAGHIVARYLKDYANLDVYTTSRKSSQDIFHFYYDASDARTIETIIRTVKPDYIVNCIGLLVSDSITSPDLAVKINAYLPNYLSMLSKKCNFKLVHISTDCVFDGLVGGYIESSVPNETNFYGRSKALGEIFDSNNITIRTSIIGPELKENGTGLFHWFMSQKGKVSGYSNVLWSGVTTLELAKFIAYFILQGAGLHGCYHLVNNVSISKMNLLKCINDGFDCYKDIYDDPTKKYNKTLKNTNLVSEYEVPSYPIMIGDLYNWINEYKDVFLAYQVYLK